MYQIDNSTVVTTIPAPSAAGSPGFFTDGNPATGAAATILPAEFMNTLMMENLNVLSAAGIAPKKGLYNQLSLAIAKIVSSGAAWDKITGKPTTLKGYGITDAIPNNNPLPGGSMDLHAGNFAFVTARSESHLARNAYWDGSNWVSHNNAEPSYRISCTANGFSCSSAPPTQGAITWTLSPIATGVDLASKADKAKTLAGYGITDAYTYLQTDNLLSSKANKAKTLNGYGITDAFQNTNPLPNGSLDFHAGNFAFVSSQVESHMCANQYYNGTTYVRYNTDQSASKISCTTDGVTISTINRAGVERTGKAITSLDAATESVPGVSNVASIAQVNAGGDDAAFVTPKKARWGFAFSASQNGYICLPTWLGGFMLQWGYVYESQSATDYRAFTIPFPGACLGMVMSVEAATQGGHNSGYGFVTQVIDRVKFIWSVGGSLGGGGYGYYLAWGS